MMGSCVLYYECTHCGKPCETKFYQGDYFEPERKNSATENADEAGRL